MALGWMGLFTLAALAPAGAVDSAAEREALIRGGLAAVNREDYAGALEAARGIGFRDALDPAGHFIAAVAHQTRMSDYRVRRWEAEFESEIDQAIRKARLRVQQEGSAENHFLLGAAEGYRCVYSFRRRRWLKALGAARSAVRGLRQAHALAPELVDPLLGLALNEYGRSKVRVFGLSFFRTPLADTIAALERVRDKGRFVSVNAEYSLQMIHYETGGFEQALAANERLYARYPRNPVCLYNRALLLERAGRPEEALAGWGRLVDVLAETERPSDGFLAECHWRRARLHHAAGRTGDARDEIGRARQHVERYREDEEIDGPYEGFDDVRDAIDRLEREWRH